MIAGASGFLGKHLADHLRRDGHTVVGLTRGRAGEHESTWDPDAGTVDAPLVQGADAVVNLAGTSIAGNPHSARWRRDVMESRVRTTTLLAETIAAAERPPAFLAGNGISWYGDHGAEPVTEASESRGQALLTRVTREWEAATGPAHEAGARVCVLRTAPVLDGSSAPLKPLKTLFSLGLGARLGSGEQFFPVISLRDWISAAAFLLGSRDVSGAFNLCAPQTPTNAEFTRALARAVHRPAWLAVPAPVLKVAAGAMAPEVLGSVNARPAALERAGYDFLDDDIASVLGAGLSG